jgi:tetratricopeptide (TPR) repeat protein
LLLAASEAAYGRGAFEAARRQLERALELAVDESRPAQAELGLAQLDMIEGLNERALERLDTVDGLLSPDDAELRSDALGLRSRVCWLSGRWDEALSSANAAVAALAGLPESRQLARALARLSQIEMLKQRHESVAHSREGIAVARRVGDSFAEWNATINLFTQEAAEGIAPDPDQISSIVQSAAEAGEFEEGYRAIINFIWAASGYLPVDRIELVVADARRRLADVPAPGSIGPYLEVSAAMCLLVPSARWTEADPVLREFEGREELAVSTRLAHLATAGGLAFRRGDVQQTNQLLEKLRPLALASGELQRIIPMAAVVLPWLARSGELDELRVLTDELLTVVDRQWPAVLDSVPVVRALADAGETELLARTAESIRETPDLSAHTQTALLAAEGLLALQRGNVGEAIEQLELAADRKRQLGRSYDAACLELDLAQALEADGQTEASKEVRASAAAVLEPLRCVNPF